MTAPTPRDCDDFMADATELALGHVDEPRRGDLLHHASDCAGCGRYLAELVVVTDRLLELAPEADPPPGFEARAVAGMGPNGARRRAPRLAVAAGTAAALVLVVAVAWSTWVGDGVDSSPTDPVAAAVVGRGGDTIGSVQVQRTPTTRLIVALDGPGGWTGVWTCQVRLDDDWIDVGSWTADEATYGVWAARLPPEVVEPTAMRIVGDRGGVIATADLAG